MSYVATTVLTILFTIGFLVIYKFVVNPQLVFTLDVTTMAQCPDRWNFDAISRMCKPAYETHCLPFDPTVSTLNTALAKCNVARSCGTTWSGHCA
jgi:hypothetical protein